MIFFDAHIHFYPQYNIDRLCDAFMARARRLAPAADQFAMAVMLRQDQGTLEELLIASEPTRLRWRTTGKVADNAYLISDGSASIYLFAARQIACLERVELLGLFYEEPIPDGLPIYETLARLREANVPTVLAWGLGKWLGKRFHVVREVIETNAQSDMMLIGDSAMRPCFWAEPRLMRRARGLGWPVVYGSDPLPRAGDETVGGRYATMVAGKLGMNAAEDMRRLLLGAATPGLLRAVGRRHGLLGTILRIG